MGTLQTIPNSVNSLRDNAEPRQRNTREGVETRRDAPTITCRVCRIDKAESEFYKKDRTGRFDTTCKSCRIIAQRERTLGISQEEYLVWYKAQGGRCGICHRRLYSRRYKAFSVDHDHTTGAIRGLLCHNCNGALGMFQDDPERLARAAQWVKA